MCESDEACWLARTEVKLTDLRDERGAIDLGAARRAASRGLATAIGSGGCVKGVGPSKSNFQGLDHITNKNSRFLSQGFWP